MTELAAPTRSRREVVLVSCPPWKTDFPNLALAYLSTYLRENGFPTWVSDFNVDFYHRVGPELQPYWGLTDSFLWFEPEFLRKTFHAHMEAVNELVDSILDRPGKLVGFSMHSNNTMFTLEVLQTLRDRGCPKRIVVGGPAVQLKVPRDPGSLYLMGYKSPLGEGYRAIVHHQELRELADVWVLGEGEETLLELARRSEAGIPLDGTPGTVRFAGGEPTASYVERHSLANLDAIPYPSFEEFDLDRYTYEDSGGVRAVPILASRGCVRKCTMCFERMLWEGYRRRSADHVVEEMAAHVERLGVTHFAFNDLLINGDLRQLEGICDRLIESGLEVGWWGNAIVQKKMTPALFEKMSRAGVKALIYGIESGADPVLKKMRKGYVAEHADRCLKLGHEHGIQNVVNLIVGFPGETPSDFQKTVDFVHRNHDRIARVGVLATCLVYENSELDFASDRFGIVRDSMDFEKVRGPVILWEDANGLDYASRRDRFQEIFAILRRYEVPVTGVDDFETLPRAEQARQLFTMWSSPAQLDRVKASEGLWSFPLEAIVKMEDESLRVAALEFIREEAGAWMCFTHLLLTTLSDPSERVREIALDTLLSHPRPLPPADVLTLLRSEEPSTRLRAARLLEDLEDPRLWVSVLTHLVEEGYFSDEREDVPSPLRRLHESWCAVAALDRDLSDSEAIDFHDNAEAAAQLFLQERLLREGRISSRPSLLAHTLDVGPETVRRRALTCLDDVTTSDFVEVLAPVLLRGDAAMKQRACLRVGHDRLARLEDSVAGLMGDPDGYVREAAAWALARLESAHVVDHLWDLITSQDLDHPTLPPSLQGALSPYREAWLSLSSLLSSEGRSPGDEDLAALFDEVGVPGRLVVLRSLAEEDALFRWPALIERAMDSTDGSVRRECARVIRGIPVGAPVDVPPRRALACLPLEGQGPDSGLGVLEDTLRAQQEAPGLAAALFSLIAVPDSTRRERIREIHRSHMPLEAMENVLVDLLESSDSRARQAAGWALARLQSPRVADHLWGLFSTPSSHERLPEELKEVLRPCREAVEDAAKLRVEELEHRFAGSTALTRIVILREMSLRGAVGDHPWILDLGNRDPSPDVRCETQRILRGAPIGARLDLPE